MNVADQVRQMGLKIGDTIQGTQHHRMGWHEARLTLLWVGKEVAAWSVITRTKDDPEWSEPREAANWVLGCRDWEICS